MVDSSFRSVNLINESQQLASNTAEDLQVQREKLERTNQRLDAMQDDLNESDRNITGLKSIWGTMSNWFKKPVSRATPPPSKPNDNDLEESERDLSGDIRATDQDIQQNLQKLDNVEPGFGGSGSARGRQQQQQSYGVSSRQPQSVDAIVDNNLDQMLAGLTALKTQGLALGSEIDSQNAIIDDIQGKVEKTDARVGAQESRIRKILKK